MSTRCMLGFYHSEETEERPDLEDPHTLIYRHSDGYPEGVLPDIIPMLVYFSKERGNDPQYQAARVLQYMMNMSDKNANEWRMRQTNNEKKPFDIEKADTYELLGYGISMELHGDIEYYYAIYPDRVDIYKVPMGESYSKFVHLQTIRFERLDEAIADDIFREIEARSGL